MFLLSRVPKPCWCITHKKYLLSVRSPLRSNRIRSFYTFNFFHWVYTRQGNVLFVYPDQRLGFCLCLWDQKPTHLPSRAEGACLQTWAVENSRSSDLLSKFLPPLNDRLHLSSMNAVSAFPGNHALFALIKKNHMFFSLDISYPDTITHAAGVFLFVIY